jgi:hypothetical protein
MVLRLNQEIHVPRLHVHGADRTWHHPTSRSPSHRVPDMCDHPQSSAPGLLLLPRSSSLHAMPHLPPAHHERSKHDSLNETNIKEKQNEIVPDSNSNLAKLMTHHNQTKELTTWFLNLPLDESIDNKSTKFKVRIQDPMKHSYKTQKAKKRSRRSSRRRKTTKASKRHEKRQSQAKWQGRAKKTSEEQEKLKIDTPPKINSP